MLISLGKQPEAQDLVDALAECHHRIRRFADMACALARASAPAADDVRNTAAQIRRYFAEALPLHVADEDVDIAPALARLVPDVEQTLRALTAEHRDHEPEVARLVELCAALERAPQDLPALAPELDRIAHGLRAHLLDHLELEERVVFPALRALPASVQTELLAKVRGRRGAALLRAQSSAAAGNGESRK